LANVGTYVSQYTASHHSISIHCCEKCKYDNFRVSTWRHFVAFCSHSIIREKVSRSATKSLTRKPRDFLKGCVRPTHFVHGHHTIAERVCQAQTVCFMNTIRMAERLFQTNNLCFMKIIRFLEGGVRHRMCVSLTSHDWLNVCVRHRMCVSLTSHDWLNGCVRHRMCELQ